MIPDGMPCTRDCGERCAWCAVTCEKWRAYVARREKEYAERLLKKNPGMTVGQARLVRMQYMRERNRRR